MGARAGAGIVPVAVHVDYRDYIGWNDAYAKRKLSQRQRMALVYTPQVALQGHDFRKWGTQAFDDAVARINAQPARAHLRLEIVGAHEDALDVQTRARLAATAGEAALYIAVFRAGLRTLEQRYVVLEWEGPFEVKGELFQRRRLPLLPGASPANSGAAAFVQDRRTGELLQALLRSPC